MFARFKDELAAAGLPL